MFGPWKSTLSYTYKGKTHKVKVIVKKYVNPCKSVKVGGTNVTSELNVLDVTPAKKLAKRKLKVVPKSGWKVTGITCSLSNGKEKTVKNGAKLSAKCQEVYVSLVKTKTGQPQTITIFKS